MLRNFLVPNLVKKSTQLLAPASARDNSDLHYQDDPYYVVYKYTEDTSASMTPQQQLGQDVGESPLYSSCHHQLYCMWCVDHHSLLLLTQGVSLLTDQQSARISFFPEGYTSSEATYQCFYTLFQDIRHRNMSTQPPSTSSVWTRPSLITYITRCVVNTW